MKPIHVVIFAKAPRPGHVKTRLIPALGVQGATRLARYLLDHALAQAMHADVGTVELCATPADEGAWHDIRIPITVRRREQGEGDLGERLTRASERVIASGNAVLLMGTDCPALDAAYLRRFAQTLASADVVMAPAADGGYVALGLNRYHPRIFADIPWSTSAVASETLRRIGELGWSVSQFPTLHDIDEPADLNWLPPDWLESRSPEGDASTSIRTC
jgi:rSAM/selenodomain-associated transferase 1